VTVNLDIWHAEHCDTIIVRFKVIGRGQRRKMLLKWLVQSRMRGSGSVNNNSNCATGVCGL